MNGAKTWERDLPIKRALLLVNTGSRRGAEGIDAALDGLKAAGIAVVRPQLASSADIGAAIQAHRDQVDAVILGGGDGTMNAAAEALVDTGLPFGILPLGTANDLARVLGIPPDPVAATQIIVTGRRRRIDIGRANERLFFNIATIGLSARLAASMNRETKRWFGALAYPLTLIRVGMGTPFHVRIRANGQTTEQIAIQIAVGNGRYHGGGIVVHEAAAIDDGVLHLYALAPQSAWALLRRLPWLLRGQHRDTPGVTTITADRIEVETNKRLKINTDGELTTHTPVSFAVLPRALEVFAPDDAGDASESVA